MAKKIILALIILIIIELFFISIFNTNNINIYIDGVNVDVESHIITNNINITNLNSDICDITLTAMNNTTSNITTLKENINTLCNSYGLTDVTITIDSIIGENQIPIVVYVDGTSMLPTLQDGQRVLINKTQDIHVGDIVVAESDEYGGIIKRVGEINGDSIYLESDNKNISYEYIHGVLYEVKGITTWVDISDINGVAIEY